MRNFKRFLTLVLAVLMIASTFVVSSSAAFTDVSADNKALTKAVNLLSYLGVTKGTTDTTFSPDTLVTREQMAAFIYRLMKAGRSAEGGTNSTAFKDLEDPTFFSMVSWAAGQNIIKGRDATTFDPKGEIILQDAYTMIIRALGYEKNETLPYPFGYIDYAEEMDLDENLPSTLNYGDALSRGNVAILLYNTFFAEMYDKDALKYVTNYVVQADGSYKAEVVPVSEQQTVAEKVFNVRETTQRVVATPNYYFNDSTIDTTFDVDVLMFQDVETGASAGYHTFEELDLAGKADDYFLSDFTLYIKDETVDGKTEQVILYAEPLLVKKEGVRATVGKSSTAYYAYEGTSNEYHYEPNGLLTVDGVKTYMWDAPYSYSKPSITTALSSAAYYAKLNEDNVKFIGLAAQEEEDQYHFVTAEYDPQNDIDTLMKTVDYVDSTGALVPEVQTYSPATFATAMNDMYWDGYYELDTYDCDGDGKIDYIWYKPFTFGQLNGDDDFTTVDEHVNNNTSSSYDPTLNLSSRAIVEGGIPTIYTNEATVVGESFKDEDFALAYVNGPANYIKVNKIVAKTRTSVKSYVNAWIALLADGTQATNADVSRKIYGYFLGDVSDETTIDGKFLSRMHAYDGLPKNSTEWGVIKNFYILNGTLLYTDSNLSSSWNTSNNILIVKTKDADGDGAGEGLSTAMGAKVNGVIKMFPYLDVYAYGFDGKEISQVAINAENNDPETAYIEPGVYDFAAYDNKLCTFTKDDDDVYSINLISDANNDDLTVLDSEDEAAAYVNPSPLSGLYLNKVSGSTYRLLTDIDENTSYALSYTNEDGRSRDVKYLTIRDDTKIIIQSEDENGATIYTQYSKSKLPNFDNALRNIQLVIVNNPNSTATEYLAAFYAEADELVAPVGEGLVTDYRIVKSTNPAENSADGLWHINYTVYNPITGAIETAISNASASTAAAVVRKVQFPAGALVSCIDGKIQDSVTQAEANEKTIFSVNDVTLGSGKLVKVLSFEANELEVDRFIHDAPKAMLKTNASTKVAFLEVNGYNPDTATIAVGKLEDLASESSKFRNWTEVRKDSSNPSSALVAKYEDDIEIFYTIDGDAAYQDYDLVNFVLIVRRKFTNDQFVARGGDID